jgi:protein O-mannosyl-transferase
MNSPTATKDDSPGSLPVSLPVVCIVMFGVFFLIGFGLYARGLDAPFYYDSVRMYQPEIFAREGLAGAARILPQRPIPMITFYGNFLMGGLSAEYLRITNVLLLSGVAVLVMMMISLLLEQAWRGVSNILRLRWTLAAMCGLLFMIHPLNVYVTLYIWQRMALLSCLFYYGALVAYLAVRMGKVKHTAIGYGICGVLAVGALLSKENSVTLPAAWLLLEIGLFKPSWKELFVRALVYGILWIAAVKLMSQLYPFASAEFSSGIEKSLGARYQKAGVSLLDVAYTQCRVLFSYLESILLPVPSRVQLIVPQVISRSLTDPPATLFAVGGVFAMGIAGLAFLKRRPLMGIGLLFFLGTLIPESFAAPMYASFSHRAVLPMLGVLIVAGDLAMRFLLGESTRGHRQLAIVALICSGTAYVGFLGMVTYMKTDLWRRPLAFWEETARWIPWDDPNLERLAGRDVLNNLGASYLRAGDVAPSVKYFRRAVELDPVAWPVWYNLGLAHARLGEPAKAVEAFRNVLVHNPDHTASKKYLDSLAAGDNSTIAPQETQP